MAKEPENATPAAELVPTDERHELDVFGYNPDLDFQKLALEARYRAMGFRLVSKEDLIGVPFVVVGVTYREGYPREGKVADYVSVECVVADKRTLEAAPVRSQLPEPLAVYPNEPVIFNDSGTGIRRTITQLLNNDGIIDVGKPSQDPDQNVFDRAMQFWDKGSEVAMDGVGKDNDFTYLAMRGLRKSDYEWQGQPATTFYFG